MEGIEMTLNETESDLLIPLPPLYVLEVTDTLNSLIKRAHGDRVLSHNIQQILRNARDQIHFESQIKKQR